MATLVNQPPAVSSTVEMLGGMNSALHELQAADELIVAQTALIDHTQHDFFINDNVYASPDAQFLKGSHHEPMLNPFEYKFPSEFQTDYLCSPPDIILSTHPLDLNAHSVEDLSTQLDEMVIDDSDSSLSASPESIDNQPSPIYLANAEPLSSAYTNFSLSPPAPSFYNFLEEVGIDMDQYAELSRRYSPDVEWEDIPLSVREQMHETYLAQIGSLCNDMEGISLSQNSSGSVSPLVIEEFDVTAAADPSSATGFSIEIMEDPSLMPLRNLICIDSFTAAGEEEQLESALWSLT